MAALETSGNQQPEPHTPRPQAGSVKLYELVIRSELMNLLSLFHYWASSSLTLAQENQFDERHLSQHPTLFFNYATYPFSLSTCREHQRGKSII